MSDFDITSYMQEICSSLKATKKYTFVSVSSVKNMEGVLNDRRSAYFFAVDDSQEGYIFENEGGGFFERRPVQVILLGRLERYPDLEGRKRILAEVRDIYRKIVSRLIRDSYRFEPIAYINTDSIPFDEIPGQFAGGTAGLIFTFTVDIPISLEYDADEWDS